MRIRVSTVIGAVIWKKEAVRGFSESVWERDWRGGDVRVLWARE